MEPGQIGLMVGIIAFEFVLWLVAEGVGYGFAQAQPQNKTLQTLGKVLLAPVQWAFRVLHLGTGGEVTEEDFISIVDESEQQDIIDESQKEMITNIFELDELVASDIMTHRTELFGVNETATLREIVPSLIEHGFSRVPVYRKSLDKITGFLYVKDLLQLWEDGASAEKPVSSCVRPAMFVPESCRAQDLLVEFKRKRTQIAVVVDEYGGTSGVVSMEDILEEIVGNIQDEFDDEAEEISVTEQGVFALGSADIEDVFDALGLPLPETAEDEDFDSVGGLVTERLGRIPAADETVSVAYGGALFTVLAASERRIEKLLCQTEMPKEQTEGIDAQGENAAQ